MFDSLISALTGKYRYKIVFGLLILAIVIGIMFIVLFMLIGILFAV